MKCIVRSYGLGGGAPRSLLQHIMVLKKTGYDNIICLTSEGDESLLTEYKNNVNYIIMRKSPAELWEEKKRLDAFREYEYEYSLLKKEMPQLVIVLGEINGALYSYICKKLGIRLIIYIAGAELNTNEQVIELWENCNVICFSEENADTICKHYSPEHTFIIPNRIAINYHFSDLRTHYQNKCSIVKILIVSRLTDSKIKSVYSLLNLLKEVAGEHNLIKVRIAGSGNKEKELSAYCQGIISPYLKITLLGHVDALCEQFKWAHIVAGKGRSVIEPIIMNRVGCIIGEDGRICFCSLDSFDLLYHYNFSGRGIVNDDPLFEIQDAIKRIRNGEILESDIIEVSSIVEKHYSAIYLPEKLKTVLDNLPELEYKKQGVFLPYQFIRFLMKKIEGKVVNKWIHMNLSN